PRVDCGDLLRADRRPRHSDIAQLGILGKVGRGGLDIVGVEQIEDLLCARLEVGDGHGRPPYLGRSERACGPSRPPCFSFWFLALYEHQKPEEAVKPCSANGNGRIQEARKDLLLRNSIAGESYASLAR